MTATRRLSSRDLRWSPACLMSPATAWQGKTIADRPVLVMVGLTGSGKTTTLDRLLGLLPIAALLPDRRELTDAMIIPAITGAGTRPLRDRRERFKATAAFRDRYPGGMAEILAGLECRVDLPDGLLVFDGLRGTAEVLFAAENLPHALFVALRIGPAPRLLRLCGRGDAFDDASIGELATKPQDGEQNRREAVRDIFTAQDFQALGDDEGMTRAIDALSVTSVPLDTIARNAAIVVEESRHYDLDAALAVLDRRAANRTIVVDVESHDAEATAEAIAAYVRRTII